MQEAEAKAAASEEKERSVNERLSQSLSRITVLETQVCASFLAKQKIRYYYLLVLRPHFRIYSQVIFRGDYWVMQITILRTEQTQLSRSLEKERQRASETRQEYLAIKEEAAMQEGRAKQLEEEIKELRARHKKELQEAAEHRELLEKVVNCDNLRKNSCTAMYFIGFRTV